MTNKNNYYFSINSTGILNLNQTYGGLNPNVTKVVFTEGPVDPWSSVGLTKDLNRRAPVIIIDGIKLI